VLKTIVKKYDAEIHAQSALDAALQIRRTPGFAADAIRVVRLRTFRVAHQIIGGGEEGDKRLVRTKEDADHSLPYMLAVALLDGEIEPQQYTPERIGAEDVQNLLNRVTIVPDPALSADFPDKMRAELEVEMNDGDVLNVAREDYHGFHTRPLDWAAARKKFDRVTTGFLTPDEQDALADVIASLERHDVADLTALLGRIQPPSPSEANRERD
jgi:2-methylcitrate dehydratase